MTPDVTVYQDQPVTIVVSVLDGVGGSALPAPADAATASIQSPLGVVTAVTATLRAGADVVVEISIASDVLDILGTWRFECAITVDGNEQTVREGVIWVRRSIV